MSEISAEEVKELNIIIQKLAEENAEMREQLKECVRVKYWGLYYRGIDFGRQTKLHFFPID